MCEVLVRVVAAVNECRLLATGISGGIGARKSLTRKVLEFRRIGMSSSVGLWYVESPASLPLCSQKAES